MTSSNSLHTDLDVLVIGTGAGGAPLLARLAQAGLKVAALEADGCCWVVRQARGRSGGGSSAWWSG